MRRRPVPGPAGVRAAFDAAAGARGFSLTPQQRDAADVLARVAAGAGSPPARGAWLVGPVGRGKTFLLDVVAAAVPGARRLHLHAFFRELHAAVHACRGRPTAVRDALEEVLGGCPLLCFDEFAVDDPGDAMLLTRVLRELPRRGTVLVATSNTRIDDLLPDPVHHHLALPGIALLHELTEEVPVDGPVDHRTGAGAPGRRREGFATGWAVSPGTPRQLAALGLDVDGGPGVDVPAGTWVLRAREAGGGMVRFSFADLCEAPTAVADVVALVPRYRRWVLQDVPRLRERGPDARQRFANLVDVLCDAGAQLVLVSQQPLADVLDPGPGRHTAPDWPPGYARTRSRLAMLRTAPPGR